MKTYLLFLFLSLSLVSVKAKDKYMESFLVAVDSTLEQHDYYKNVLDSKILSLRQQAEMAQTDEELYLIHRFLIENYKTYISDSAIVYLNKNEELAHKLGNEHYVVETLLTKAYVYSAVGIFQLAEQCLTQLQAHKLSKGEKIDYYVQRIYYYNHLKDFYNMPYRFEVEQYCDSILILDQDPRSSAYLWARYWKEREEEDTSELRALLKARIDSFEEPDGIWYSNLAYALSYLYYLSGNNEQSLKYMTLSLINDLKRNNNDVPALHIIATWICAEGEYIRAYKYMQYALKQQSIFPARTQAYTLMNTMQSIYDMSIQRTKEEDQWKKYTIFWLVTVSVSLLFALIYLLSLRKKRLSVQKELTQKNKELDQNVQELHQVQEQLKQMNADLQGKNTQVARMNALLVNANHVKEIHIANLFTQCSGYITKMDELRKNIYRKLKTKQYNDLMKLTSSSETLVADEVQELYKNFDALFLNIYPNFIQELNSLLRPEEQIILRNTNTLNNDLRILALIRLGINNSTKIASFLHLSPQTVYNSRMKMRNKATLSNLEFSERVKQLGNPSRGLFHR